jgi:hypothetical protein
MWSPGFSSSTARKGASYVVRQLRHAVVVARALAQRRGLGALHEHEVHAELPDLDAAERLPLGHLLVEVPGQQRHTLAAARRGVVDGGERALVGRVEADRAVVELLAEVVLGTCGEVAGEGLLPDQRDDRFRQQQRSDDR